MATVIRLRETGGPEKLLPEEEPLRPPGPGEVSVQQTAIGLNFIDIYYRSGVYPMQLPAVVGQEGAGVVTAVGAGVEGFEEGDRVAYAGALGAYASERTLGTARLVKLPAHVSAELAASVMLKGMTAEYLTQRMGDLEQGDVVLFHAAAGGVGQIACQWLASMGVTVIGTVGRREKVELAKKNGCAHVIDLSEEDVRERVAALTQGKGVKVAYDSVGKTTIDASLDALRPRGLLVSFGQSSGLPPPLELKRLGGERSLFVTRPSMHAYTHERAELEASAAKLFDVLERGVVKLAPPTVFKLTRAADAHRALANRETTGSVVLVP